MFIPTSPIQEMDPSTSENLRNQVTAANNAYLVALQAYRTAAMDSHMDPFADDFHASVPGLQALFENERALLSALSDAIDALEDYERVPCSVPTYFDR